MARKKSSAIEQLPTLFDSIAPKKVSASLSMPQSQPGPLVSRGFSSTSQLLERFKVKESEGYISQEFQDFGYRLALELDDMPHKSLYIKMAKKESRAILEQALSFVSDSNAKSKAKLFMWKVSQLKQPKKPAEVENNNT